MPKFHVVGKVVGSKYLGCFEAETAEEAVSKALNKGEAYVSLCHQCAEQCEDGEIEDATADLAEGD